MKQLRRSAFVIAAYVAATAALGSNWGGDTVDYVESIVQFSHGVDHWMWDFAHLLWRPLGWSVASMVHPIADERLNVMAVLIGIAWIAGLACAIALHSVVMRVTGTLWIANVVCAFLIFTQVFLNWAQTGSAYVPGLALMVIALDMALAGRSIVAAIACAGAVCLWAPYVLVVPATLFAPALLDGFTRERVIASGRALLVAAGITIAAYAAVMLPQGITTPHAIAAWIATSGHGVEYHGAPRMILGVTRTFVSTGNDGVTFKRYLLHDPFNPVSLGDLAGMTLWKIAAVYAFLAIVAAKIATTRRRIAPFVAACAPVLALAFFFGSSEPERYLPLMPALLAGLGCCLATPSRSFRLAAFMFLAVMIVTNSIAMARPVLHRTQESVVARLSAVLPRLDDRALVFTATYQDELMAFSRTYPFHPLNHDARVHLSTLVSPGTSWNAHWCEDFATRVLTTWNRGGAAWISKRALSARPRREWSWAEGDDRRVSWTDFPLLLSHLELGDSTAAEDGFVLIVPSPHNRRFLTGLTTSALVAERKSISHR